MTNFLEKIEALRSSDEAEELLIELLVALNNEQVSEQDYDLLKAQIKVAIEVLPSQSDLYYMEKEDIEQSIAQRRGY